MVHRSSKQEAAIFTLRVLGNQSPYPRSGYACSGYVVQWDRISVIVDLGAGTLGEYTRTNPITDVDAIVLTHDHADHISDLTVAYYALGFSEITPTRKPSVFGTSMWDRRMEAFLESTAPNPMTRVFDVRKMSDSANARIGPLHLSWTAVTHGVEAYACRLSDGKNSIVYSGDTRRCDNLRKLATGADLFLCEVGAVDDFEAERSWHMTPEEAGALAREARVRRLLLTHFAPGLEAAVAARRAMRAFDGPVEVAVQGQVISIDEYKV